MKLKRPEIHPGPWWTEDVTHDDGGACEEVVAQDHTVALVYPNQTGGEGKAIAALPEVMDRLERALFFLEDQGHMPLLQKDIVSTMLKMGYTKEEES